MLASPSVRRGDPRGRGAADRSAECYVGVRVRPPPPNRVSAIPLGPDPECPLLVGSALSAGCLEHQLSGAPGKQQSEAETVTRNHWGE